MCHILTLFIVLFKFLNIVKLLSQTKTKERIYLYIVFLKINCMTLKNVTAEKENPTAQYAYTGQYPISVVSTIEFDPNTEDPEFVLDCDLLWIQVRSCYIDPELGEWKEKVNESYRRAHIITFRDNPKIQIIYLNDNEIFLEEHQKNILRIHDLYLRTFADNTHLTVLMNELTKVMINNGARGILTNINERFDTSIEEVIDKWTRFGLEREVSVHVREYIKH